MSNKRLFLTNYIISNIAFVQANENKNYSRLYHTNNGSGQHINLLSKRYEEKAVEVHDV